MSDTILLGGDTETIDGKPLTFQIFNEPYGLADVVFVDEKNVTEKFLKYFESLPANDYVLAIHNLKFDMLEIFYPYLEAMVGKEFYFEINGWKISGVYDKVFFAVMTKGAMGKRSPARKVFIMDTFLFFKTSLEKLAKIHCPNLPKLKKPARLGKYKYTKVNKQFCAYALRDAEIAYYVLCYLDKVSKEYDLPVCVSAPHMASRIFRHKFLEHDIPLPPKNIMGACIQAYHGGKNGFVYPAGFYSGVHLADITSAYPYAMTQLPSFYNLSLYQGFKCTGHPNQVPPYGVYKLRGFVEPCKYPIFYDRHFKPVFGDCELWTTGIELNEAIAQREVIIDSLYGFYYDSEKDNYISPLKEYANYFFTFKDMSKHKADYEFFKLMMNSLYGKFIETRQAHRAFVWDEEQEALIEEVLGTAGQCFQPMIAALITAHTRAYIHRLEHEYSAIHTATDGFFTSQKVKPVKGLGGLTCTKAGDLLVLRNKLYAFFIDGKLEKYGLHAFRGKVDDLISIYLTGKGIGDRDKLQQNQYQYVKPNTLRESLNRGLQVNKFEQRIAKVNY